MKRKKMSKGKSKSAYRKGAKPKAKNVRRKPMRGGWKL